MLPEGKDIGSNQIQNKGNIKNKSKHEFGLDPENQQKGDKELNTMSAKNHHKMIDQGRKRNNGNDIDDKADGQADEVKENERRLKEKNNNYMMYKSCSGAIYGMMQNK